MHRSSLAISVAVICLLVTTGIVIGAIVAAGTDGRREPPFRMSFLHVSDLSVIAFVAAGALFLRVCSRRRTGRPWMLSSIVAAGVCPLAYGQSVSLSGDLHLFVWKYEETINSIDVDIGGNQVSTGTIRTSLDLTHPASQVCVYNFDTMTQEVHVDLLVQAPLLTSLGLPPQSMHIDEIGTITAVQPSSLVPGEPTEVFLFSATHSEGVLGPGLLQGFRFSGDDVIDHPLPPRRGIYLTINPVGQVVSVLGDTVDNFQATAAGMLTSPDGNQSIPFTGERQGLVNPTPAIPEPPAISLLSFSCILGAVSRRR